jgi:hypothetical protein
MEIVPIGIPFAIYYSAVVLLTDNAYALHENILWCPAMIDRPRL